MFNVNEESCCFENEHPNMSLKDFLTSQSNVAYRLISYTKTNDGPMIDYVEDMIYIDGKEAPSTPTYKGYFTRYIDAIEDKQTITLR